MPGDIRIAGRMARKRIVRNSSGQILDMLDESGGGWIIKGGQVVNQEEYAKMLKKQEDEREAAKAVTMAVQASAEVEAMRNGKPGAVPVPAPSAPDRVDALEQRIDAQDAKLDKILDALTKK